ncbi:MAG: DUF3575 domain-containing protein [Bacteroidales bacterium]|nr:MAG: DUF3575 domain-containing protein [Bacteroidales bacterium]
MSNRKYTPRNPFYFTRIIVLMIFLIMYCCPQNTFSQPDEKEHNIFISIDPLGFVTFGPSINAEFALGKSAGFQTGFRILNLGLCTHNILNETEDFFPDMKTSWTVNLDAKFYIKPKGKLKGFYIGPQFDYGRSRYENEFDFGGETIEEKEVNDIMVFGLGTGYKWIWENGFSLEPSYNMAFFLWKNRGEKYGDPSWDMNLFALYILSIKAGIAF